MRFQLANDTALCVCSLQNDVGREFHIDFVNQWSDKNVVRNSGGLDPFLKNKLLALLF